jgi:hypothetical protein
MLYNEQEVLVRTISPLSLYDTDRIENGASNNYFRGNVFTKPLSSNDKGIHRQTHRLPFDTTRTVQKTTHPTILQLLSVFVATATCLASRYLATIRGDTHTGTQTLFDTTRTAQKTTPPTIPLFLNVFVATATCLASRCLATIRGATHTGTQTYWKDSRSASLRWSQVSLYTYQVS